MNPREEITDLRREAWRDDALADDAPAHESAMRRHAAALCDSAANRLECAAPAPAIPANESESHRED